MQAFDIPQGTDEWLTAKAGYPSASRFSEAIQKDGPRGGKALMRRKYLRQLAGEILTGEPMDTYSNRYMEKGHEAEPDARRYYEFRTGREVTETGFILNDGMVYSPDGMVGDDGLWENKNAEPHIQIERLEKGTLPPEHKAQCMGGLMVAEREWLDFQSHCRGLPPLIVRVFRDEPYIVGLRFALQDFIEELHNLVEKIRGMYEN